MDTVTSTLGLRCALANTNPETDHEDQEYQHECLQNISRKVGHLPSLRRHLHFCVTNIVAISSVELGKLILVLGASPYCPFPCPFPKHSRVFES